MMERVVMAYDFSERCDDALAWAVDLVRAHQGRVHLVHVTAPCDDDDPRLNGLRRELAAVADEVGPEVVSHVVTGADVAATLVKYTDDLGADALVIATRGARGVARWLLGSVADAVISAAHCPVVTLRGAED